MDQYWFEARYLLETLVMKACGQDENGMDLAFTEGQIRVENKKASSKFTDAMKKARPKSSSRTNMKAALEDMFAAYMKDFTLKPQSIKDLTIIVLTDGIWAGLSNKHEVEDKIVHFVEQMRKITGYLKDRSVSIQFIQFGSDPDATYRLNLLDNEMMWRGVP